MKLFLSFLVLALFASCSGSNGGSGNSSSGGSTQTSPSASVDIAETEVKHVTEEIQNTPDHQINIEEMNTLVTDGVIAQEDLDQISQIVK